MPRQAGKYSSVGLSDRAHRFGIGLSSKGERLSISVSTSRLARALHLQYMAGCFPGRTKGLGQVSVGDEEGNAMIIAAISFFAGAVFGAVLLALCIVAKIADEKVRLASGSLQQFAHRPSR